MHRKLSNTPGGARCGMSSEALNYRGPEAICGCVSHQDKLDSILVSGGIGMLG
jgi:hypothetical protein